MAIFIQQCRKRARSHSQYLLTRWLGIESAKHVKRIRSVNLSDPEKALRKAWEQHQECYTTPKVTGSALFKKLDNFQRISPKDHVKLRELGDLLMEPQCAKEEGY